MFAPILTGDRTRGVGINHCLILLKLVMIIWQNDVLQGWRADSLFFPLSSKGDSVLKKDLE